MATVLMERKDQYDVDLLDLRNDVVFKAFFANRRNNRLLLSFLNAILGGHLAYVELTDPTVEINHSIDKASVMDLRVITDSGEQVNIEMQVKGHRAFRERMLVYWAKMYASQEETGQSYLKLKKSIQIVITDFKLLSKLHCHSKFQLIDTDNGALFSHHAEIHVLELPKVSEKQLPDLDDLGKWLLFLKGDKQLKEALSLESSTLEEAFEEIRRLSQDPKTRALAISREIGLKDQLQRELDAREDGKEEGQREIILNMLDSGLSIEMIAQAVKLPIEKINELIQ